METIHFFPFIFCHIPKKQNNLERNETHRRNLKLYINTETITQNTYIIQSILIRHYSYVYKRSVGVPQSCILSTERTHDAVSVRYVVELTQSILTYTCTFTERTHTYGAHTYI